MTKTGKLVLIGFIVDVSNSMQRNWRNREGRKVPRFEIVRDAINDQLWKISAASTSAQRTTMFFCLGMGFQKVVTLAQVNLERGQETENADELRQVPISNVVCDLLALSQVIPSVESIEYLEKELNNRWNAYAQHLLAKIREDLSGDVYGQLIDFVKTGLYESAHHSLYTSWQYRLYTGLRDLSLRKQWSTLADIFDELSVHVGNWEEKIETSCAKESDRYFNWIKQRAEDLFEENKDIYCQAIGDRLKEFASSQVQIVLELLTAGHPIERVLNYFDEARTRAIADQIYAYLNGEVEDRLRTPLGKESVNFLLTMKFELRASLSRTQLKHLTEKSIQKYAWEILEPFVRKTVFDLVEEAFKQRSEKMLLYWVNIAASREVVQPIQNIARILPQAIGENVLRSRYMFGTTPIKEALNLASMRLLDPTYKDYEKVLVIVSDGEFNVIGQEQSLAVPEDVMAELLKQSGVTIVSLYVTSKNVVSQLVSSASKRWPEGAKTMFAISSEIMDGGRIETWLAQNRYELPAGKKLFVQINQAGILQDILGGVLGL